MLWDRTLTIRCQWYKGKLTTYLFEILMSQRKKPFLGIFCCFLKGSSCFVRNRKINGCYSVGVLVIKPPLHRKLVESVPTSVYYKLVSGYRGCDTVELLALVRAGIQMFFRISRAWKGKSSPILMLDLARIRRWLQTWPLSARQVKRTIIGLGCSLCFFPSRWTSHNGILFTHCSGIKVIFQYILHDVPSVSLILNRSRFHLRL